MTASNRTVHGLVLAGGMSTRMGRDKASLLHPDGRTWLRRCHDLLLDAGCGSVALSLRADQELPDGFADIAAPPIFRDPPNASHGPLAGIAAALRSTRDVDWLIVACDLPRLDLPTLKHLVAEKKAAEKFLAYRSEFDGLPEPLCALYSSDALPLFEDAMSNDFRCPRKILIRNECRLLDPVTPGALHNANRPEDWDQP